MTSSSVVICAYADERWPALAAAVNSVAAQEPRALETIVVVDHNDGLLARARVAFAGLATVVPNAGSRGLSAARNTGAHTARGEVVAFLDDDAEATPGWLAALVAPFRHPDVIATGGLAEPAWDGGRPAWLPEEFLWVVGCSYRGLPRGRAVVRNPIGATMALRRSIWEACGGFRDGIGRVGRIPLGCEETELAIRAASLTGGRVVHEPAARVRHRVTVERATWRYFASRCLAEGVSKAWVRARVGTGPALASERGYVLRTLPAGALAALAAGRWDRAVAIAAGLALTVAGYGAGRLEAGRPGAGRPGAGRPGAGRPEASRRGAGA